MAIKNNIIAIGSFTLLMLSACTADNNPVAEQEITLTTPVIELGEVSASASRASGAWDDMVSEASIYLYMHDSADREYKPERRGDYSFDAVDGWTLSYPDQFPAPIVTGGEGSYRAGIDARIYLKANGNMPVIEHAIYGYRGSINVQANGTFTPAAALEPLTAAVLVKLKDANGADISPATESNKYRIESCSFKSFDEFSADSDGQIYPNGTAAPMFKGVITNDYLLSYANGNYLPGTYPAGLLFNVKYCAEGFTGDTAQGDNVTTWQVSSSSAITLEDGKLYTFTITLGKDAHITLASGAVSIASWDPGSEIQVGK